MPCLHCVPKRSKVHLKKTHYLFTTHAQHTGYTHTQVITSVHSSIMTLTALRYSHRRLHAKRTNAKQNMQPDMHVHNNLVNGACKQSTQMITRMHKWYTCTLFTVFGSELCTFSRLIQLTRNLRLSSFYTGLQRHLKEMLMEP